MATTSPAAVATLTTANLPANMLAPAIASKTAPRTPVAVLTCQHGPACPACVLAAARALVGSDATLTASVERLYTG